MNEFCKAELEDWMANPTFNADRSSRGGEALMDYGVPGGNGGPWCRCGVGGLVSVA